MQHNSRLNSPDRGTNVLLTSVGRRVELLRCFKEGFTRLGDRGHLIGTDIDPLAAALQELKGNHRGVLVPRTGTSDFAKRLLELCAVERPNVILPLIDPDIPVLADLQAGLLDTGVRLLSVGTEAAEVTSDKWLTYAFFNRLGLPTPKSRLAGTDIDLGFPCFIKPRRGSASQNAFLVTSPEELAYLLRRVPEAIVQEYVPGPEITTDVLCDFDGQVLATVSRQRIEVRSGEVSKGRTVHNKTIADACGRIAQALPAVGPITVQCIMSEGEPRFTEVNARLGGGVPLAIAAGVNVPEMVLRLARGERVKPLPWDGYEPDLVLTRFDLGFYIRNPGVDG